MRGIEVAQKCSVSSGAKAEWFDDSILISKLNHKINLPVLHYCRNIFAQPLSMVSIYVIRCHFKGWVIILHISFLHSIQFIYHQAGQEEIWLDKQIQDAWVLSIPETSNEFYSGDRHLNPLIVTCIGPNKQSQPILYLHLVKRYKLGHFSLVISYLGIGQNPKNRLNLVCIWFGDPKSLFGAQPCVTVRKSSVIPNVNQPLYHFICMLILLARNEYFHF